MDREPVIHAVRQREDGARGLACGLRYQEMEAGDAITIRAYLVTCPQCRDLLKPVGVDW